MAWFGRPAGGHQGPQDLGGKIQDLIQALGAATLNTNQQMGHFANNLGAMAQATNNNIAQLGQVVQQGAQAPGRGHDDDPRGG